MAASHSTGGLTTSAVAAARRLEAHAADGRGRPSAGRAPTRAAGPAGARPAAHLGVTVVQRGFEQRLVGQAQPPARQDGQEHDPFRPGGRVPARGDQVPGGGGIPGAQRGQVAAPLAAPPSRHASSPAGRVCARTNVHSGLSPASHRARGPPASAARRRSSGVGTARPAGPGPAARAAAGPAPGGRGPRPPPATRPAGPGAPRRASGPAGARPPGSPREPGPVRPRAAARPARPDGRPGGRPSAARPGRAAGGGISRDRLQAGIIRKWNIRRGVGRAGEARDGGGGNLRPVRCR